MNPSIEEVMESLMQKQSTPFQFDLHATDANLGHTFVVGPVGGEPRVSLATSLVAQRGTKVFVFDKGESVGGFMRKIARLERKISRLRRYGSRWVKVQVKRNGHLPLEDVITAVKLARRS